MRRLCLTPVREGLVDVLAEKAHYLASVLRLREGATLMVFGDGLEADAEITSVDSERVTLRVGPSRARAARREIVLLYALSKGDKVDAVVRDATELGATQIVIAETERSVVRLPANRADKRALRWAKIAEEATRQSGGTETPVIEGPLPFAASLDHVQVAHKWILDPAAKRRLGMELTRVLATPEGVAIAIGPEGGFAPAELEVARGRGFVVTSFGRTTLRTETVPAAVLGAIAVMDSR